MTALAKPTGTIQPSIFGLSDAVSLELAPELVARAKRDDMLSDLQSAVLSLLLLPLLSASVAPPWLAAMVACCSLVLIVRFGLEWVRVRSADPLECVERARVKEAEQATHSARSAAVTPFVTLSLVIAVGIVTALQFIVADLERAVTMAALVKPATFAGEWWRMLTASYLHTGVRHVVFNLTGVLVLARWIEIYDKRATVPLVYLVGVLGASLASLILTPQAVLGSSGGVLALNGYVVSDGWWRRSRLPKWLRNEGCWMLALIAITGVPGWFFIDNAGHAGGVLAGILVGTVTHSQSRIWLITGRLNVIEGVGWIAAGVLVAGAAFTVVRLTV